MQTTLLFAILYFAPFLGDWVGEAKLTAAAVIAAVFSSAFITLVWEALKAPAAIHALQSRRILTLEQTLKLDANLQIIRDEGRSLVDEGVAIYRSEIGNKRGANYLDWLGRVEAFLRENHVGCDLENFRTGLRFDPSEKEWTDAAFARKLDRLSSIVPFPPDTSARIEQLMLQPLPNTAID